MRATTFLVVSLAAATLPLGSTGASGEVWASLPTPEEVQAAYPRRDEENYSGIARLKCSVAPDGVLTGCAIVDEIPEGRGFGAAAETLLPKFRVAPDAVQRFDEGVVVRVDFDALAAERPLRGLVYKPAGYWKRLGPPGPYWPDRAQRMGLSGIALLDCRLEERRLIDCSVADVAPREWGFEFAALKMAEHGYVTAQPESEGASAPPDGVWRFRFEFRNPRSR